VKPRSWKRQAQHHRRIRRNSIYKNRGLHTAKYTDAPLRSLKREHDRRWLKALEDAERAAADQLPEQVDDVEQQLRGEYMLVQADADARREARCQALGGFSESMERELESLRQRRGETLGLVRPRPPRVPRVATPRPYLCAIPPGACYRSLTSTGHRASADGTRLAGEASVFLDESGNACCRDRSFGRA